jgi:osmoprotectant transport system ATP-binding protein
MISVRGVSKRFGDLSAVDRANLEVRDGELAVLIGPSGCGKSTLLRLINRLVEADEGQVLIAGEDTRRLRPESLRRSIGYVIQSVGLFPHLTVCENIATVPRLHRWDKARIAARVDELLALMGLDGSYRDKLPGELSGGEAQRVGVARALAADPRLLLMDEPFGSVDPLTRVRLQTEFRRIQSRLGKTVLFVTHDVEEAVRLADSIAVMKAGRILQHAPPGELIRSPAGPFVRDFLGSDYGLQLLGRFRLREALPGARAGREEADSVRREAGFAPAPGGAPCLDAEATVKDALALMIASGADRVTVQAGEQHTEFRLADVLRVLGGPA